MVEAIMGMQTAQIQGAYSTALMKRSMEDAESQALSLINDMVASVPAPAQYTFDVRACFWIIYLMLSKGLFLHRNLHLPYH